MSEGKTIFKKQNMIVIIVSSKAIAKLLADVDLGNGEWISSIKSENNTVMLGVTGNTVMGQCIIKEVKFRAECRDAVIPKHDARWDWVKQFCNQVSEQPITLSIGISGVNISTNY